MTTAQSHTAQRTIGEARRVECEAIVKGLSRAACYHLLSWTDIAVIAHKPNGDDPLRLLQLDILSYVEAGVLSPQDVRGVAEQDTPEQWAATRAAVSKVAA